MKNGDDWQYPLEDVLDKYTPYVSELYDSEDSGLILKIELAGTLEDLKTATAAIIGKRVYYSLEESVCCISQTKYSDLYGVDTTVPNTNSAYGGADLKSVNFWSRIKRLFGA